jgi:hypothetical protein
VPGRTVSRPIGVYVSGAKAAVRLPRRLRYRGSPIICAIAGADEPIDRGTDPSASGRWRGPKGLEHREVRHKNQSGQHRPRHALYSAMLPSRQTPRHSV